MKRRNVLLSAVALLGLVGAATGCGKKVDKAKGGAASGSETFSCDSFAARNQQCGDEIATVFLADLKLSPERLAKLKERMKKSFSSERFKQRCQKGWASAEGRDKEMIATLRSCFGKTGCQAFAECFVQSMKSNLKRRAPRGPGAPMTVMGAPDDGHMHAPGDGHNH